MDNSEWMRNGDYIPNRYEAQIDAIHLLFNAKRQSNPENTIGLITMSGNNPSVLVTLTEEHGKLYSALPNVKLGGSCKFINSIQIAQLALKHRQNKNQQQKIIIFVASPISEDKDALMKLGKLLKKNSISIDIIYFGGNESHSDEDLQNLNVLLANVNNNENSHLISVPPGPYALSDFLLNTPVFGDVHVGSSFMDGGNLENDPELELALRMSMEEERSRQQQASQTPPPPPPSTHQVATLTTSVAFPPAQDPINRDNDGDVQMGETEDEELNRAIAMSLAEKNENKNETEVTSIMNRIPGGSQNDKDQKDIKK